MRSSNFLNYLAEYCKQESSQLYQILIFRTTFKSSEVGLRQSLLINTNVWDYCQSLDLDKSWSDFIFQLCSQLSCLYIAEVGCPEKLGLITFLENLCRIDTSFSPSDKAVLDHIIATYYAWEKEEIGVLAVAGISPAVPMGTDISVVQTSSSNHLSDERKRRVELQREGLQQLWDLKNERLRQLRTAETIEADASLKFKLQKDIKAEELNLFSLELALGRLEEELKINAAFSPTLTAARPSTWSQEESIAEQAFEELLRQLRRDLQNISISTAYDARFNEILNKALRPITFKTGELLRADRTTIFFANEDQELSSIVAQDDKGGSIEIKVPIGKGFSGRVAQTKRVLRIGAINLDLPDATEAKKQFERTGYRTYNLLTVPVLNDHQGLVAVLQLINKLKPVYDPEAPLAERLDSVGFTEEDEAKIKDFVHRIKASLEEFQSYYKIAQRIQEIVIFTKAMQSLSAMRYDLEETRQLVMQVAQEFMDADRTTLWLFDNKKNELYAEIQTEDGSFTEQRLRLGQGYVGRAAQSRTLLNIPFDIYEMDPEGSEIARIFDQRNHYRTCSLLCMPIINVKSELLGVLQLVNKKRKGKFLEYNHQDYPKAPECFEASFTKADEERIKALSNQIATAIQEAKRSAVIKQDDHLYGMLSDITRIVRDALRADRATIFLVDHESQELWSIIADDDGEKPLEIRLAIGQGVAGEVAQTREPIIVADFYNDPRSTVAKEQDQKTGYRTYNLLGLPLLNEEGNLVAVVEFINRLKPTFNPKADLSQKVDPKGFSADLAPRIFDDYALVMLQLLKGFQDLHSLTRRQQRISRLNEALQAINRNANTPKEMLDRVIIRAQELVNADRSTLWLFDRAKNELWAKIPAKHGGMEERRVMLGQGFVGRAAESREFLNIPFDLYDDEQGAQIAKQIDRETDYRTCSLLCIPISNFYNELIGVIQLVNKRKEGRFPPYNPANWPVAPECFAASFDDEDRRLMEVFNSSAGNNLYLLELHQTLHQESQTLRDTLNGLQ